ncbi:MAG: flagellar motor switch protein FliM [Planctomycetales bacterium 12-60-4]|nr:MAG: flagellar motor switch protein FliM [Planctomycetales bacterium 12-60-4]
MGDVLSQSEVESLLAALDQGTSEPAAPAASRSRDDFRSHVTVYDFKRPERVSKEQMRAFQALHEGFSREFGASLSSMLRAIVEVKLISVDQLTYSEFVFSLENPTCFNLLWSAGLDGHFILDLSPSIVFPIVDRLLGGGKDGNSEYPSRALTEIELHLASRITNLSIQALENAWDNVCQLKLRVQQVESNPQLVQIVPPNEVIVLISFELTMGDVRGIMNLCIPFNTIEPLASKLSSDSWSAYQKKALDQQQQLHLEGGIRRAPVELVVHLATTHVTARELSQLAVGDVILTEHDVRHGAKVIVEGRPMFQAFPGTLKGRKAIRVGENLVPRAETPAVPVASPAAAAPPPAAAKTAKK